MTSQYLPAGRPVWIQPFPSGPNVRGSLPDPPSIRTNPNDPRPKAIRRLPSLHQFATRSQLALTALRNPTIFAIGRHRCSHIQGEPLSKHVLRKLPPPLIQILRVVQAVASL